MSERERERERIEKESRRDKLLIKSVTERTRGNAYKTVSSFEDFYRPKCVTKKQRVKTCSWKAQNSGILARGGACFYHQSWFVIEFATITASFDEQNRVRSQRVPTTKRTECRES